MSLQRIFTISLTGRCRNGWKNKRNLNLKEVKNEKYN
jgi:hypothetical protein